MSPGLGARTPTNVYFIGTALTDTVLTGPGTIRSSQAEGHFSPGGGTRSVYGQALRVEVMGAPWRERLPLTVSEVILVPWDYDPSCVPVVWGQSWRWLAPGTRGLYSGSLRDRSQWVNGIPTLDVRAPQFSPFPGRTTRIPGATSRLTPEQTLDFIEHLPEATLVASDPDSALVVVKAWVVRNPSLAEHWPVTQVISSYTWSVHDRRVRRTPSPITGTFRIVLTLGPADSLVVFSRTEPRAMSEVHSGDRSNREVVGFYVMTVCAASIESLPARYAGPDQTPSCYHAVSSEPILRSADSTVWRGDIDVGQIARAFEPDTSLARELTPHPLQPGAGDIRWQFLRGQWVAYADGRVRFEMTRTSRSGRAFAVHAQRVDAAVLIPRR